MIKILFLSIAVLLTASAVASADDCLPPMTPTAEQKAVLLKYTEDQRIKALADAWIGDLRERHLASDLDIRVFVNIFGNWTVQARQFHSDFPVINRSVRYDKVTGEVTWHDNDGSGGCWNPINPTAEIRLLQPPKSILD